MNHYSEFLNYIKQLGESDFFVNTITQGGFDKIDINKNNIFPLLHVNVTGGTFTNSSTIIFNVQLGCFNKRITNKEINTTDYFNNDNEVDNLNITLAVLNRIYSKMIVDFDDNDIVADENASIEPYVLEYSNLLDGWILDFNVEMSNDKLNLCDA